MRENTKRNWCVLITLEVRNAFNSIHCKVIIENLEKKNIYQYLVNEIKDYLKDRQPTTKAGKVVSITAGIPQGSVLGPILWKVIDDPIPRQEIGRYYLLYGFRRRPGLGD